MVTLTENASPCCRRVWQKLADDGWMENLLDWECPRCGVNYKPKTTGAPGASITVWEAQEWTALN
jgi:hypothetical protein